MYKIDSFIKWTAQDENGTYSYVGQVKMMHGDTVIFETENDGMMGIHKDDGTFTVVDRPKSWNKPKSVMMPAVKVKKKKASGAPTKLDAVIALLKEKPHLTSNRKVAIENIVTHVGMSPAGASTYFAKAKKMIDVGE